MHVGVFAAELTHAHGWAHYSLSMIRALRTAGVDLSVITTHDSPIPDDIADLRIVRALPSVSPMRRWFLLRGIGCLPQIDRAVRACDVIHTFVEPYAPLAALVAGKRRYFVSAHGSYARVDRAYPIWERPIMRRAFGGAVRVLCVSRYTEQVAQSVMTGLRTQVIPNGVDPERFSGLPEVPKDGRTVLTVGAVKPRKGVLYLVRALAQVRQHIADARLIVVGSLADVDYVAQVRAEIERLGLHDQVVLTGRISDDALRAHYARADVFALASVNEDWKFEGFGLAALEASAAGLPVIGSRECGIEDAIDDGVTGCLTPQRDAAAVADALVRVLRDRSLRAAMGAAGRAKAALMTWARAAAGVVEVYRS
jgi:glycosyltransferase involved in cell wall biosynthesis